MKPLFAAVLALSMAMSAPAQAQSLDLFPNDNDGFFDEGDNFFDRGRNRYPERLPCLTDFQVRREVSSLGYTDVALNAPNGRYVQVRASRDGAVYLLEFGYCSGRIEDSQRIR